MDTLRRSSSTTCGAPSPATILDRLVSKVHRIELKGASHRQKLQTLFSFVQFGENCPCYFLRVATTALTAGKTYGKNLFESVLWVVNLFNGSTNDSNISADTSLSPSWLNLAVPGLGFVVGAVNSLAGSLKEQSPPTPMVFDIKTTSIGTITPNPVQSSVMTIELPDPMEGSYEEESTFNRHFGVFTLLDRPTVHYSSFFNTSDTGMDGDPVFTTGQAYQLQEESIEYALNYSILGYRHPIGRNEPQIYAALEFE